MRKFKILTIFLSCILLISIVLTSCTPPSSDNNTAEDNTTGNVESTTDGTVEPKGDPDKTEQTADTDTEELSVDLTDESVEETTDNTESEAGSDSASDTNATETESLEQTETIEETEAITDIMIGEVIDAPYASNFTVSRVFSDDMIVQRGDHIRVWGFSDPYQDGKKISGEFKGMFAETIVKDGKWCLTFGARLEADTQGADMKIYTDSKTVTIRNILVGDVYMVVGQSNVQYTVQAHLEVADPATQGGGEQAIDPSSIIRILYRNAYDKEGYPTQGTREVCPDLIGDRQWELTSVGSTLPSSAIGYYFAREMVERTEGKVPVGVIEIGFSGRPLGSFLPNEVADALNADTYNAQTGQYSATGKNNYLGSGRYVYNHHMYAFENFAIAGMVWYQGESNNTLKEARKYNKTFSALVEHMRSTHNLINRDFPVFIVEFPSIYKEPAEYSGTQAWRYWELGIIRSYMGSIPMQLENSYIAVSSDLWANREYFNNLHPFCKYEQAKRVADLAEVIILGKGTLEEATGPILKSFEISEDGLSAVLTFDNVGEGLTTSDGGVNVKGIEVYFSKSGFTVSEAPAKAKITAKDQITISHSQKIRGISYNYRSENFYGEEINLCNSYGNPASAFNTDFE